MYFSTIKMSHTAKDDKDFWNRTKKEKSLYSLFTELFSENLLADNKFVFRQEFGSCYPSFYSLSEKIPVDNSGRWKIFSDDYNPFFEEEEEYEFLLRFCPAIIKRESGTLLRYDIISDALERKSKAIFTSSEEQKRTEIIKEAAFEWIQMKAPETGFSADFKYFKADGYKEHRFTDSFGKQIEFHTVESAGIMKVSDRYKLKKTLFNGAGDYREFGCGMLLIK